MKTRIENVLSVEELDAIRGGEMQEYAVRDAAFRAGDSNCCNVDIDIKRDL
jgi:hypothetical protein